MTNLSEVKVSVADLIKGLIVAAPCLLTIGSAIWYFSTWSERVDNRLDDIDKDLQGIHRRIEVQRGPAAAREQYELGGLIRWQRSVKRISNL